MEVKGAEPTSWSHLAGEVMSNLLREIKHQSRTAADVLERAELCTDLDIQALTREDLLELFPEPENFKLRRTIFEIIHKEKPVDQLKEFIPHESLRAKLMYRMVVSGKTFGAHLKLMERVKDKVQNQLQLVEGDQDHEVTFVFCPIVSGVVSDDVEAAMTDVKVSSDDKPVILVLMHHTRGAKCTSNVKTWRDDNNVVLFVHVFYHETIHGILKCQPNNDAVSKIQNELLKRFFPGSNDSSGNTRGVGAEVV